MYQVQPSPAPPTPASFIARRLFSLTGVVPIGAFLVLHMFTYARALGGRASVEDAVARRMDAPYLLFAEVGLVYLPLVYHAGYGVKIALESRPNVGAYGHSRNWAYLLQRVTGLVALVYIVLHFWQFRLQMLLGKMVLADVYPKLCASLSATTAGGVPLVAIGTLVGIAACVFHLANGLWSFGVTWGLTASRSAQRVSGALCGVFGVALFFVGAHTVIYFATGAALFEVGSGRAASDVGCREPSATAVETSRGPRWAAR